MISYNFIEYKASLDNGKDFVPDRKLVVLLHGYGVNGHVMEKMARTFHDGLPTAEVHSLHADRRISRPRKRIVPKTVDMPREWVGEGRVLLPKGQFEWFPTRGGFPTWKGRLYHAATKMKRYLYQLMAVKGLQPKDIILGGFSQGGAVALYTSMIMEDELGAVFSHSAPFFGRFKVKSRPPTLFLFGTKDESIEDRYFVQSVETLGALNPNTRFVSMDGLGHRMSHDSCFICANFAAEMVYFDD